MDSSRLLRQQLEQQWRSEVPLVGAEFQTLAQRTTAQAVVRRSWQDRLLAWGQVVIAALAAGDAPRVQQVSTAAGAVWRVYDPVSDRTEQFASEMELRAWLEQRYYEG